VITFCSGIAAEWGKMKSYIMLFAGFLVVIPYMAFRDGTDYTAMRFNFASQPNYKPICHSSA